MTEFDMVIAAVLFGIYAVCGLAAVVLLVRAYRRPPTELDDRLSRVDLELRAKEGRQP